MTKIFSMFRTPSPHEVARKQLVDAQHACLDAMAHREHAAAMVSYRTAQIERLSAFLAVSDA